MLQRPDANAIPSRGVDWSPLPLPDLRLRALQFMRTATGFHNEEICGNDEW